MRKATAAKRKTPTLRRSKRRSTKKNASLYQEPERVSTTAGTLGTVITRKAMAQTVLRAMEKMPGYTKSLLRAAEMCHNGKVCPLSDTKFEVTEQMFRYTVDLTLGCNCRESTAEGTQICVHQHAAYLFSQTTKAWSENRVNHNTAVHVSRKPEAEISFSLNMDGHKIRVRAKGDRFSDLRSLVTYMLKWKKHQR